MKQLNLNEKQLKFLKENFCIECEPDSKEFWLEVIGSILEALDYGECGIDDKEFKKLFQNELREILNEISDEECEEYFINLDDFKVWLEG